MSPGAGFVVWFSVTLTFLSLVVWTGLRARRAFHLSFVACAVGSLWVTVLYAYDLGKVYDLPAAGWITPFHLTLAKVNTACLLLPVITGVRTLFVPATLRWHRRVAFAVLGMTLVTAATGGLMLYLSPPRAG